MGNSIGGRKKAKVMKINGETMKLKTPIRACDILNNHPGHVLLDSESVKHFGIRAQPLDLQQELKPKKIYFLIEQPNFPEGRAPIRRVRSGIQRGAKDRLECLMLSRRAVTDLVRPASVSLRPDNVVPPPVQVKMRMPRAQLDKLVEESKDRAEVARKIISLYMGNVSNDENRLIHQEGHWKPTLDSFRESFKAHKDVRSANFLETDGSDNALEGTIKQDLVSS